MSPAVSRSSLPPGRGLLTVESRMLPRVCQVPPPPTDVAFAKPEGY